MTHRDLPREAGAVPFPILVGHKLAEERAHSGETDNLVTITAAILLSLVTVISFAGTDLAEFLTMFARPTPLSLNGKGSPTLFIPAARENEAIDGGIVPKPRRV